MTASDVFPRRPMFHRLQQIKPTLGRVLRRLDRPLYPLFAGVLVLVAARSFYGEMLDQTGGEWSAPLDDVFIHFDFARATARGYPFQWSEGNGYSSGNTSLTYPFILAFGYWIGFRGSTLMLWAAIVACCSVFGVLLVAPRLGRGLPAPARYLIPPALLGVGALDWALFSGMEVAWFLTLWAVALSFALDHRSCPSHRRPVRGWLLGFTGMLVVATRPEAATSVAVLGFTAGWLVWRRSERVAPVLATIFRAGLPGVCLLAVQGIVNRMLTGDFPAAGALVKLAYYDPYMTAQEKWETYLFHVRYAILRNIEHHFSAVPLLGWIPVALAGIALLSRRTRFSATVLLSSAVSFILLVGMNGQVRWQNERYTMPAVAWLLMAATLGLGALLFRPRSPLPRIAWMPRAIVALAAVTAFAVFQVPKMRDQVWFFGRASRNIRDQHTTAGRLLRHGLQPPPRRVLVGDAGAILYASDLPGLDIIGLGGYRGLPMARSSGHGLGATVELIERIPEHERPDVFALYPTWWGKFPLWFGRHVTSVWVDGNVICGGSEKAIYAADWRLLNTGASPATLNANQLIADQLDVADIVDERLHHYEFPQPQAGFVDMRVLADPIDPKRDVLDSGRQITEGRSERFVLRNRSRIPASRLIFRTAPTNIGHVEVSLDGVVVGNVELQPAGTWVEPYVDLPASIQPGQEIQIALTPRGTHNWVNYHVWLVTPP